MTSKNIYIVEMKHTQRPIKWIIENARTKKQVFKQFKYLSGFFNLTFTEFKKAFKVFKW